MEKSARIALVSIAIIACSRGDSPPADTASSAKPLLPGMYSLDDFSRLRWLEGRWRGTTQDGTNPFYEEYRFLNDSTIAKYSFADSTFAKASDSSQVKLRGGLIRDEGLTASWQVTRLDSAGADFAPDRGATNYFTWTPASPTSWTATLRWTDKQGRPQTVEYVLHKFAR
jgi:hypothetical protein